MIRLLALAAAGVLLGACGTQQSYEGPKRAAGEVAHISGDLRHRAPLTHPIILRTLIWPSWTAGTFSSKVA